MLRLGIVVIFVITLTASGAFPPQLALKDQEYPFKFDFETSELITDFEENEDSLDAKIVNLGYVVPPQNKSANDKDLTVPQISSKYGYHTEVHWAITHDGYVLEMHRINGKQNEPARANGNKVVFLMHGLLSSSSQWIIAGPEKSLAFLLSDAGYDVWMGNSRGNTYSKKHMSMSPKDSQFWTFSWHEIGISDLPAMIDYILAVTQQPKLSYIGHSQGTTAFFVLTSAMPWYNDRFTAFYALSPIAYMGKMFSPIFQFLARFANQLNVLFIMLGQHEFLPGGKLWSQIADKVCKDGSFTQDICSNLLFLMAGFNRDQMNATLIPIISNHLPAGAAAKQLVHFAQSIKSHKFRQYNYGFIGNLRRYRRITPPDYDLRKITTPSYLFYSTNDWLCNPKDARKIYNELPNRKGFFRVPDKKFNHLDYIFAKDVKELVNDKVLSLMSRH